VVKIAVVLLFIDGVGLGEMADHNPWVTYPTPCIRQLFGGMPLVREAAGRHGPDLLLLETDACLGVEGLPQSATGQATIFTGKNAAREMGKHMSGLPFRRLREWVQKDNIYLQFEKKGWKATFANAYTKEYFERPATKRGWVSVTTATIQSSREPVRFFPELVEGKAVYHDITRTILKKTGMDVEEITPEQAARHLWSIARDYDLVVHEFFLSDRAGHKQDPWLLQYVTHHYDRFLGELVRLKGPEDTIVLVSDHGNSEDLRVKTHTVNPVPTLVIGDIDAFSEIDTGAWDLTGIAPLLHRIVSRNKNGVKDR
jgi:2,3-bisphosphoglycerate-independent phosphoglycerate mutase